MKKKALEEKIFPSNAFFCPKTTKLRNFLQIRCRNCNATYKNVHKYYNKRKYAFIKIRKFIFNYKLENIVKNIVEAEERMHKKRKGFWFWSLLFCILMTVNFSGFCEVRAEKADGEEAVAPDNIADEGYDVALCIDNSKNIWSQQDLRDQAVRSICNLAVGSDIRVGGVYFGNSVYKSLGLTSMEAKDGSLEVLQDFLNETEKDQGNQNGNIAAGLEGAHQLFEDQDASRNRIIILFTSGISEEENRDNIRKQTELIEKENIPIYCVYLQSHGDDEEYLREMVDYFRTENSFDEDRFKKITEDQIDELSRQFSEIFYAMQNDMRYRTVSVDSIGKMSFYVPALGVEKLQVFLDGNVEYEAVLDSPTDKQEDALLWTDGKSAYITVNDPTVGDWALDITGENKELVKGSIAYYTYMSAKAEVKESDGVQILQVRFYDRDGNLVEVNPGAEITAEILFEGDEPGNKEILLSPKGETWESAPLILEKTGDCQIKINVRYEDFIDLSYTLERKVTQPATVPKEEKTDIDYKIVIAATAVLAVLAGSFLLFLGKKRRRKRIYDEAQEQREKLERKYNSVLQLYKKFTELADKLEGTAGNFQERFQAFQKDYGEKLPCEVLEVYGLIFTFDKKEKEKIRAEVSRTKNIAYEKRLEIDQKKQGLIIPESNMSETILKKILGEIRACRELLSIQEDFLRLELSEMSKPWKTLEKEFKDFCWSQEALDRMLDTPITCTLSVAWKNFTGLQPGSTRTRLVTGYFLLEDMTFHTDKGRITLKEALEGRKTGILVSGFQKEQGEGLEIRSPEKFSVRKYKTNEKPKECSRAVLFKGSKYEICVADIEPFILEVK